MSILNLKRFDHGKNTAENVGLRIRFVRIRHSEISQYKKISTVNLKYVIIIRNITRDA